MGQINSNTNQYYIGITFLEATPRTDKNGRTKSYCQMHTLFILFLIIVIDFFIMFNRLSYSKYLFKYIIL
jgi:hypothetical protein